jgi:DNA-binding NarL/FixJ family response regulator
MNHQSCVRVLVVDDFQPWCRFVVNVLRTNERWQVLEIISDGIEAVRKTQELRPDLVVLAIGLPGLNGIEAARQIRKLSPESKVLFLTVDSDSDTAKAAFDAGGHGYVVKSDAGAELIAAAEALLLGRKYVSRSVAGYRLTDGDNE